MRKINILLIITLAVAMTASFAFGQVGLASAQGWAPAGVVVEYNPGRSITIVDQKGNQQQYTISSTVRILPPVRANALAVGTFVTIISPASLSQGKQMAVGVVVHPNIPPGWNVPSKFATPSATGGAVDTVKATAIDTPVASETATELATGTPLATDTATPTATVTGTQLPIDTPTSTETPMSVETSTDTPTATAIPIGVGTAPSTNALIEWLRSLFQQILTRR